ncbi:MAG: aminotransferase class V-fold PLP-dependent enzyme [Defluviitaleaceae bacterium]|nr:aminotransferase class V-fold PLP-dependent enzyme [Defluviitaleaceae bacterium]
MNTDIKYFDCSSTSLQKPPEVFEAVAHSMANFANPSRGAYGAAMDAGRCIFAARCALAKLFGSSPERVIFTSNATESLNLVINNLISPNDHVITTVLEHNSVLRPLFRIPNISISHVGLGDNNRLLYDGFSKNLQPNTKAVILTHASNLTGEILDLKYISGFCKTHNLLLIVDAAQSGGLIPILSDNLGITALCFTGHKGLFAPQGIGGICLREGLKLQPLKVGGSGSESFSPKHPDELPESLEAGTMNIPGIAGLLAGVRYIESMGIDNIFRKSKKLSVAFHKEVSKIDGVKILSMVENSIPIVTINIKNLDSTEVAEYLWQYQKICVRAGTHCAPLAHKALKIANQGAVRFSFSHFNTLDEVNAAVCAVKEISKGA